MNLKCKIKCAKIESVWNKARSGGSNTNRDGIAAAARIEHSALVHLAPVSILQENDVCDNNSRRVLRSNILCYYVFDREF